jgi:hypothetical protein
VSVLQRDCGKAVWNSDVLRRPPRMRGTGVKDVNIRPHHSPCFSASQRRSQSGPSDVLRMIRTPYSYNLSFLKKELMMVVPRSSPA